MTAIIEYGLGNLESVKNAMARLGEPCVATHDKDLIRQASHVILPGVGEAAYAMERLRALGLDALIPTLTLPVLGICIGMQVMCQHSEEGDADCLGIFSTKVRRLQPDLAAGIKVPHMGWDNVSGLETGLFEGIPDGAFFYYVHSYAPDLCEDTIAQTEYGRQFSAALARDNFYGVQFHPEKSGEVGERMLANFLRMS